MAADENQAKYEAELTNHAATIAELKAKRDEMQKIQHELTTLRSERGTMEVQLKSAQAEGCSCAAGVGGVNCVA